MELAAPAHCRAAQAEYLLLVAQATNQRPLILAERLIQIQALAVLVAAMQVLLSAEVVEAAQADTSKKQLHLFPRLTLIQLVLVEPPELLERVELQAVLVARV
jgi:hypothetical protein